MSKIIVITPISLVVEKLEAVDSGEEVQATKTEFAIAITRSDCIVTDVSKGSKEIQEFCEVHRPINQLLFYGDVEVGMM